jgi:hypothetical protein
MDQVIEPRHLRRNQMFTQDRGATASYRTIARGFGGGWARTYRREQQQRPAATRQPRRHGLGDSRIRSGRSQLDVMLTSSSVTDI